MTTRSFLMWYLSAVIVVGATGASAYQALLRLHAATPAAVAQAQVPPPAPAIAPPAPVSAQAASLPKLRPPLATASNSLPPLRKRAVAAHAPRHRPTAVASAHREYPPASPWGYPPPPPPPGYGYYADPARYPYPGYYPYYPRYGYYRSF